MVINSVLNCIQSGSNGNNAVLNRTKSGNKSAPTERLVSWHLFQVTSVGDADATKTEQLFCDQVSRSLKVVRVTRAFVSGHPHPSRAQRCRPASSWRAARHRPSPSECTERSTNLEVATLQLASSIQVQVRDCLIHLNFSSLWSPLVLKWPGSWTWDLSLM